MPQAWILSLTARERALLMVLVAIQFVHVLDSMIVIPLAPTLMKELLLSTSQFGALVSSYSLAAAAAGILGAFVLDHFDRKRALVFLFMGLIAGTFVCAVSKSVFFIFGGRIVAGACGGLIQALLFAIIGDCFKEDKRGAATGIVMSSYSIATVIGVPVTLYLAAHATWRLPFLVLSAVGVLVAILAMVLLPQLRGHLTFVAKTNAAIKKARDEVQIFPSTPLAVLLAKRNTRFAFLLIVTLMFAGFSVIPYMSAYLVSNLKLTHENLATVFFIGGVTTFITARLTGSLADRFGKRRVYSLLALISAIPTLALTHLQQTSLAIVLVVTTAFTLTIAARGIPALTMITASVGPGLRGRFLSLTSSVQQASSGIATFVAGLILTQSPNGELLNFNWAGNLSVFFILCSVIIANQIRPVSN